MYSLDGWMTDRLASVFLGDNGWWCMLTTYITTAPYIFSIFLWGKKLSFFMPILLCETRWSILCQQLIEQRMQPQKIFIKFQRVLRVGWKTKHPSSALLWILCSSLQLFLLWWSWVLFITVIRWQWTGSLGYYSGMKMHLVWAHHQNAALIFHKSCSWHSIIYCYMRAWRKAPVGM